MVLENSDIKLLRKQIHTKMDALQNKIDKLEKADDILKAIQFKGREVNGVAVFDVPPKDILEDVDIPETKRQAIFDKITTRIAAI
ncbi:MAG: hypothetical protein ACYTG7_22355 [Planctomycetota bacterium]|jgi:hypothetical protein